MTDCGVCISSNFDGYCDFQDHKLVRARKQHRCCECNRTIQPGEQYHIESGKYDGEIFSYKTCLTCYDIRGTFTCGGGHTFETLWEDMEETVFRKLTTGCLSRLSLPESKAVVIQKWQEWKGLVVPEETA